MSTRKISNPESFRENVRKEIRKILGDATSSGNSLASQRELQDNLELSAPQALCNIANSTMSINLEKAIYNYAIQEANFKKIVKKWENECFAHLYIDRLRTIYLNFKNKDFLDRLLTGDLTPHMAIFMTHQEMNPDRWNSLIEKKKILDANKFTNNAVASTDLFTCGRCRSKKCTFYTAQTRSADEAETIFITCLDCGKNWKKN